jgi:hypothetical protein
MFQSNEIDLGVGRSAKEDLIIEANGWIFITWVFIKMMRSGPGMGYVHGWIGTLG